MKSLIVGCLWLACMGGVFPQDCTSEMIRDLVSSATDVGVVSLSWQPVPSNISFSHYMVSYQPNSHSDGRRSQAVLKPASQDGRVTSTIEQLLSFTSYTITVSLSCDGGGAGPGAVSTVTTIHSIPSSSVSNLTQNSEGSSGNAHLVRLQWEPLLDTQWNGEPRSYDVSIFRSPDTRPQQTHRVPFPANRLLLRLDSGDYGATVAATNAAGTADTTASLQFRVGDGSGSSSVADYPYFYIIIPGIVFLAFIIVITIVIFKKVHESRKQSVSYVRDITEKMNYGGFNNMMPMREISPQSPNTSASLPVSSTATNSSPFPHSHQQLATRPLPLSPATPGLIQAEDSPHFGMGGHGHMTSSSSAGALKLSATGANHPGPLPSLDEGVEHSGGYPFTRTMTDQSLGTSVFSPKSVISAPIVHAMPPQQHQQRPEATAGRAQSYRGRSNTLGGIPSPYEVPDNGNTLPHDFQSRPSSAHPNIQQKHNNGAGGDMGATFPPPPTHSPPHLTHSAGDMRPNMGEDHAHQVGGAHHHPHQHSHHHQPPPHHPPAGGNTLPRVSPNQRSFSTSATQGHSVDPRGVGMTTMRSEGNIPSPPDNDRSVFHPTQSSNGPDSIVCIQPPLDSDLELQSTSSYGEVGPPTGMGGGRRHSGEQGRFNNHHPLPPSQHHFPGQGPHNQHHPAHHHHPGMLNGPLDSGESFNYFDGEGGMIPAHTANIHPEHGMKEKAMAASTAAGGGGRRESLFSETSTELSITSGSSEKDTSPSGWGDREHRGTRSDVGVSHHRQHRRHHERHHRSNTPPERDLQVSSSEV